METFFASYKDTFSAIGAIGSMAAVIVALWFGYLALMQNARVRLKCMLYVNEYSILNDNQLQTKHHTISLSMVNNSFFDVYINMDVGIKYGRWGKYIRMVPSAIITDEQDYRLESRVITLKRGEYKSVVFSYHKDRSIVLSYFYEDIMTCNDKLAKRNFLGRFGNKLCIELTDGKRIKIKNNIPKNVPNK